MNKESEKTGGSKPQDLEKITRYLNERIEFCRIMDNRQTRETYTELLNKFEAGAFEVDTEKRDYSADIKLAEIHGFCIDCTSRLICENNSAMEKECYESGTKCNFKPRKVSEVDNEQKTTRET